MRHLSFKITSLGIALLALFVFSVSFASDVSDFERLLQEAIRSNQETATTDTTNRTVVRDPQPVPGPGGPARTVTTRPINPNVASASPSPASTTSAVISGGWTTVTPNEPGTFVPEPEVTEAPEFLTPPAPSAFVESNIEPPVPSAVSRPLFVSPAEIGSLIPEGLFDLTEGSGIEVAIIEEDADVIELVPGFADLETITEPRRRTEPRAPASAPPQRSELSDILDNFANDRGVEESRENETTVPEKTRVTVSVPDFDSEDDDTVWKVIDASSVGNPHVQDKLKLMYEEVMNGMRTRGVLNRYDMWRAFARKCLRDTVGVNTGSELDGRWRLPWFEHLYYEPVRSVLEVEEYSRELFAGLKGGHRHLAELMPGIRYRMNVRKREDAGIRFPLVTTPMEALNEVKRALLIAASSHARAYSRLTPTELKELNDNFVETFVGPRATSGHTIPARSVGRRHSDMLAKLDKTGLYDAAEALIPLTNAALLDLLAQLPENALPQVTIHGQRFQRLTTAAGDIIIAGRENNTFDLDSPEMREVICVISLGGNDTYREGTSNLSRPIMVILDLGGNNTFVGTRPGIQGGSVMGVSMVVTHGEGNSTFQARDVAQGSGMGGVGILINNSGSNTYTALRRAQGHALIGLGLLVDRSFSDAKFKASMWAQGLGANGGFGLLHKSGGNNHFYLGGMYLDSYPEHPGYDGWGQGVGAGLRQVGNGGIGIILTGEGDDVFEADYFSGGGGYWLGIGIARDFGGNDIRHGTTLTTYDGRPRPASGRGTGGAESRWTRFVNGWGCHYAVGYMFDDWGDDVYGGQIMGTGMGWDLAFGFLGDFGGSDRYTSTGNMKHGVGAESSIGILFSYGGDDSFAGRSHGNAGTNLTYHPPASGGNFSFLINYGGNNRYGGAPVAANNRGNTPGANTNIIRNSYLQRGSASGFLINRPLESEAQADLLALRQAIETRNREIEEYDAMVERMREQAAERRQRFVPPRQRRPQPISETQILSAVPDFGTAVRRADAAETTAR